MPEDLKYNYIVKSISYGLEILNIPSELKASDLYLFVKVSGPYNINRLLKDDK